MTRAKVKSPTVTVAGWALKAGLRRVEHARADDEARPILTYVLFEARAEGLRLVTADNYRIAIQTIEYEPETKPDHEAFGTFLLEGRHIRVLMAMLPKKGIVTLTYADRLMTFAVDDFSIAIRCADGQYPNYEQVAIPTGDPTVVVALNPRYLAELGGGNRGAVTCRLAVRDPLTPIVFEDTDGLYTEILMPVRLVP
jgi:DNA polymerase III sliding clamp (beta) subunit (PCNA family)